MKKCNTIFPTILFPKIDIDGSISNILLSILEGSTPVCLYTYDTCQACYNEEFYIETKDSYSKYAYETILPIVSDLYGRGRMDNKITLRFDVNVWDVDNEPYTIPIYITYKDAKIVISSKVHFWSTIDGVNAYRVVMPYSHYNQGKEFEWYTDHKGNKFEDFESSIGE